MFRVRAPKRNDSAKLQKGSEIKKKKGSLCKLPPFDIGISSLLILEFEHHGEVEVASYGDTVVLTGLPSGHLLHYPQSFAVKVFVDTFDNCRGSDGAIFLDHESYNHATLDVVLLCRFRIADVVAEPFHKSGLASGEFSLLFHRNEDFLLLGLLRLGLLDHYLLLHRLELIGVVATFLSYDTAGGVVLFLGIHVHHLVLHLVGVDDGDLGYLYGGEHLFGHLYLGLFEFLPALPLPE